MQPAQAEPPSSFTVSPYPSCFRLHPPSFASISEGEAERRHLFGVSNDEHFARYYGMVPRLTLDSGNARQLLELIWGRSNQREFALLR